MSMIKSDQCKLIIYEQMDGIYTDHSMLYHIEYPFQVKMFCLQIKTLLIT